MDVYGSHLEGASGYSTYATLRNIMLSLVWKDSVVINDDVIVM